MKRTVLAMAVMALGMGSAQAQDYQMELGGSYADYNSDVGADDSVMALDFTFHLNGVKTAGRPLAEAAFLGHSNNLFAEYATFDDADVDGWNVGGEFYVNQLYLRGEYGSTDFAGTSVDTLAARIGFMLAPNLRLAAGVDRIDDDTPGSDAANNLVLEGKYVSEMGGGTALNLIGDLTFADDAVDTTTLNLGADYYFSAIASLGVNLTSSDSDAPSGSTTDFGLEGRYFFTPTFSGQLAYNTANDGDDDVIGARLALRF